MLCLRILVFRRSLTMFLVVDLSKLYLHVFLNCVGFDLTVFMLLRL